jgi:two-component system, cell cycle sensor histidine kinase and response regulator CckA
LLRSTEVGQADFRFVSPASSSAASSEAARAAELVHVLGRARSLPELLQPALEAFCRATGWRVAQAWVPGPAGDALVVAPAWYADDRAFEPLRELSERLRFARGDGFPGTVWESSRPQWLEPFHHGAWPREELVRELGLRAALGVKVVDRDELLAVLEFFTDAERAEDEHTIVLASILAAHLAALVSRHRNEERLADSEARFRAVTDAAADAILCADAEGRVTYVNRCAEALFGWPADDLLGRPARVLVPDELTERYDAGIARLREDGEPCRLGRPTELVGLRRDGSEFPLELSLAPLEGRDGIEGWTAIVRDLSERRREHEALARTTQRLVEAQRIAGLGSWEWDVAADEVRWSEEMVRIFGIEEPPPRLTYEHFLQRVHPDDREMVAATVQHAFEEQTSFSFRHRIVRGDGEVLTLQGHGEVVSEGGRPVRMIGAALDITDRLESERERVELERRLQEAKRMESIGRLAGGVAHDFNNLLTVILSYTSQLGSHAGRDEDLAEAVKEIRQAAEDGAALTRQLLTFSRRDAVTPRALDLNDAIRARAAALQRALGDDVALELELADGDCVVELDRGQLEQILMNLTLNARDALPQGGTVTLTTARRGDRVRLFVADTGEGMSPEVRARAFEPFFTTKPRGQGTGLGLASVHGIVTRAGGDIEIRPRRGGGTVVSLDLPHSEQAPEPLAPAAADVPDARPRGTILVVEDQAAIRALVHRSLVRAGYDVRTARDGDAALAAAAADAPDLLLTDVVMPGLSGAELAQRMRARLPELRVVYMSGHPFELRQEVDAAEPDAVLRKPFTPDELLDAIGRALHGRAPIAV